MYKHVHKLMCNRGNFMKLQECVYKEAGLLNQDIECDWLDWMFCKWANVFIYVVPYKNFPSSGLMW